MTAAARRLAKGPLVVVAAALASALSVSCGASLLKLPAGPGTLAPDGRDAIDHATAVCRAISTITLEIAVHGSVGGHHVRGRLSAGLARPASARLEAVASFGQPIFMFVANGTDATLLLPRDRRVIEHGRPDAVLDAVAGVPLDASALRAVLTGCATAPDAAGARALGDEWRLVTEGDDALYLRREGVTMAWRLVTTLHHSAGGGWRAEYGHFENGLPRAIRLVSVPAGRFDLQLELSQIDVNTPLEAGVFRIEVPVSADPISLDELRQSGPLRVK